MTDEKELIAILRLLNTHKVGYKTFYGLISDFGSAEAAVNELNKNSKNKPWPEEKAKAEIEKAKKERVAIITYSDEDYPSRLRN